MATTTRLTPATVVSEEGATFDVEACLMEAVIKLVLVTPGADRLATREVEEEGEGTSREASTSLAVDVDGSKFAAS